MKGSDMEQERLSDFLNSPAQMLKDGAAEVRVRGLSLALNEPHEELLEQDLDGDLFRVISC
jgi:hypothetical protein